MESTLKTLTRRAVLVVLSAAATLLFAGCEQGYFNYSSVDAVIDTGGKEIQDLYREYVEPQPDVTLDPTQFGEAEERKLARLLTPVDEKVYRLIKYMDGEDRLPRENWFQRLFERHPWISGVMVVDQYGSSIFQHPLDYNREVDVEALLALGAPEVDADAAPMEPAAMKAEALDTASGDPAVSEELVQEDAVLMETEVETAEAEPLDVAMVETEPAPEAKPWSDHSLRGMAGESPLGPEIYLVQPFYEDNDWRGLIVVYFDPRNLLEFCPEPDELVMVTPERVIWSAKYPDAAQNLAQQEWNAVLQDQVYGQLETAGRDFYWLGRHLGRFYMIYATATPTEEEQDAEEAAREAAEQAAEQAAAEAN